jgi:hypothetical protein
VTRVFWRASGRLGSKGRRVEAFSFTRARPLGRRKVTGLVRNRPTSTPTPLHPHRTSKNVSGTAVRSASFGIGALGVKRRGEELGHYPTTEGNDQVGSLEYIPIDNHPSTYCGRPNKQPYFNSLFHGFMTSSLRVSHIIYPVRQTNTLRISLPP